MPTVRKRRLLKIIGAVAGIGLVGWIFTQRAIRVEPQHNGRTLTGWLEHARQLNEKLADPEHPESDPRWRECQDALRHMKADALPILLDDLQSRESKLKIGMENLADKRTV